MKHTELPTRRTVLVSGGLAAVLAASTSACQQSPDTDRRLVFGSLQQAMQEVDTLAAAKSLKSTAVWTFAQTLAHCAQSIEFSMTGFPQPKSAVFQHTAGALALQVFSWRGRMTHDLSEPIPGAPALEPGLANDVALARLRLAVQNFQAFTQPLRPHFAYGELEHGAYAQAHAMHLANHLSGFSIPA